MTNTVYNMSKNYKILLLAFFALIVACLTIFIFTNQNKELTAKEIIKTCVNDEKCYINYFKAMVSKEGAERALNKLEAVSVYKGNLLESTFCHTMAHYIGQEAYRIEGDVVLTKDIKDCSGGFIHGVADGASSKLDREGYIEFYSKYCLLDREFSYAVSCMHGLGHALYKNKFNKINADYVCGAVGENIEATIEEPGVVTISSILLNYSGNCTDGFIMEEYTNNKTVFTKTEKSACEGFTGYNLNFCAFEFIRIKNISSKGVESLKTFSTQCQEYTNKDIKALCAYYVGENIIDVADKGDPSKLIREFFNICSGEEIYSNGCIVGFVTKKVSFKINLDNNEACALFKGERNKYCLDTFTNTK